MAVKKVDEYVEGTGRGEEEDGEERHIDAPSVRTYWR